MQLLAGLLVAIGISLLTLQIFGLSHRAIGTPSASEDGISGYSQPMIEEQFLANALAQGIGGSQKDYAERVTVLVYQGLAHGAPTELHCAHSWLLCALSRVRSHALMYTQNPDRIVESRSAICSQSARVVTEIARRDNLPARLVTLQGKVIAEILVDGNWQISDPDYGIHLPLPFSTATETPEWQPQVAERLKSKGHADQTIATYLQLYDPNPGAVFFHPIYAPHEPKPWLIERASVGRSWLIPLLLITLGVLGLAAQRWIVAPAKSFRNQTGSLP